MNEQDILHAIMLRIGRGMSRIFRNNVGIGWTGRITRQGTTIIVEDARPLHAGLVKGSSDLIGWHSIEIEPHHVGKRLAVFLAVEAKSQRGLISDHQSSFLKAVESAGGLAIVAHSADEAAEEIEKKISRAA